MKKVRAKDVRIGQTVKGAVIQDEFTGPVAADDQAVLKVTNRYDRGDTIKLREMSFRPKVTRRHIISEPDAVLELVS